MTDRELLELAAKAAGYVVEYDDGRFSKRPGFKSYGQMWNPLTDDGDALRLAVALGMDIYSAMGMAGDTTICDFQKEVDKEPVYEDHGSDALSATRRAIVRAAAELQRQKENK